MSATSSTASFSPASQCGTKASTCTLASQPSALAKEASLARFLSNLMDLNKGKLLEDPDFDWLAPFDGIEAQQQPGQEASPMDISLKPEGVAEQAPSPFSFSATPIPNPYAVRSPAHQTPHIVVARPAGAERCVVTTGEHVTPIHTPQAPVPEMPTRTLRSGRRVIPKQPESAPSMTNSESDEDYDEDDEESGGTRRQHSAPARTGGKPVKTGRLRLLKEGAALPEVEEPVQRGPGRKKRTAPVLVETEEGEIKHVSPSEYRRLRRRVTNRLSARRMRKKHAEERSLIKNIAQTQELVDEKEALAKRLQAAEEANRLLALENAHWRSRWQASMQPVHEGVSGEMDAFEAQASASFPGPQPVASHFVVQQGHVPQPSAAYAFQQPAGPVTLTFPSLQLPPQAAAGQAVALMPDIPASSQPMVYPGHVLQ